MKYDNFNTAKPKETGWYWMQNMTMTNEPEIVLVRPVDLLDPNSELGFQHFASTAVTPLSSASVGLMQWQKAEWE
ncbi:hypothetical protein AAFF31_001391 [Escherichia coli]|nr:hypothetical protein [uncultured bacterium]EIV9519549.1 hypothetical protein [Klebsiella pneumoniae]EKW3350400.1 hypothetical protein [Klebsiella pneumoniae]